MLVDVDVDNYSEKCYWERRWWAKTPNRTETSMPDEAPIHAQHMHNERRMRRNSTARLGWRWIRVFFLSTYNLWNWFWMKYLGIVWSFDWSDKFLNTNLLRIISAEIFFSLPNNWKNPENHEIVERPSKLKQHFRMQESISGESYSSLTDISLPNEPVAFASKLKQQQSSNSLLLILIVAQMRYPG